MAIREKGTRKKHGTVYELLGLEPLACQLDLGGHNLDCSKAYYGPPNQTPGGVSGAVRPMELNNESSTLAATMPSRDKKSAAPQKPFSGAARASQDMAPSLFNSHKSLVVSQSDHDKTNVEDESYRLIVGLFPNGAGKPEFEAKTRAAFDSLMDRGCDPAAVHERVRDNKASYRWPIDAFKDEDPLIDLAVLSAPFKCPLTANTEYGGATPPFQMSEFTLILLWRGIPAEMRRLPAQ